MGADSSTRLAATSGAVFLSYTSQDTDSASRICEALRRAGIEVWFDQSELRGGDVWDQKIRREIHDCALFIPVISANTASRHEGYFRLEWDLADQRTHMMSRNRVFIVPVCLDATNETGADVPDSFRRVQWTRLSAGETPRAFVERVRSLVSPEPPLGPAANVSPAHPVSSSAPPRGSGTRASGWSQRTAITLAAVIVAGALAYFAIDRFWESKRKPSPSATAPAVPAAASAAFAPPPHSIAVLPFLNLSGEASQDYFSEGLTEELLNSLAEIEGLQVAARTSSFSFKEHPDIVTVAHKLNVASVLEGSVRRSAHKVRITAQLIDALTGSHLWSKTYDRDLGDVLNLQTEIATAVASALKVTLLGDVTAKIELGGTRNPAALDAYLRGAKANSTPEKKNLETAIAEYTQAISLDPNYALAFAARSRALSGYAAEFATGTTIREDFARAEADARRAIALAPELAEGYLALARFFEMGALDFALASESYGRAQALAPGSARVLDSYGRFAAYTGRSDAGIDAVRRAVTLDPLNPSIRRHLGYSLMAARRYGEAVAAFHDALALIPDSATDYAFLGLVYYMMGDLRNAQSSCESSPTQNGWIHMCLAVSYNRLGRHTDAEAELAKYQTLNGDSAAYQYAAIYAQWGTLTKAFEWLETAMRLRDPGMANLKTDPLMDPLRKEPRFQSMERELRFPN